MNEKTFYRTFDTFLRSWRATEDANRAVKSTYHVDCRFVYLETRGEFQEQPRKIGFIGVNR